MLNPISSRRTAAVALVIALASLSTACKKSPTEPGASNAIGNEQPTLSAAKAQSGQ